MDERAMESPRPGEAAYAWIGERTEAVCFRWRGALMAASSICPHMGARLAVDLVRGRIACPWHGLSFSLPDLASDHPRYRTLKALPCREEGGSVRVGGGS